MNFTAVLILDPESSDAMGIALLTMLAVSPILLFVLSCHAWRHSPAILRAVRVVVWTAMLLLGSLLLGVVLFSLVMLVLAVIG